MGFLFEGSSVQEEEDPAGLTARKTHGYRPIVAQSTHENPTRTFPHNRSPRIRATAYHTASYFRYHTTFGNCPKHITLVKDSDTTVELIATSMKH